jgi:isopentenyl diphosphate isomerase/L-lactate dehydrogenase-like FMN-dependent dehydrogenase
MTEYPLDLAGFEAAARDAAEPYAWEYLSRGSGMDVTLHDNVAAWSRWQLLPHVLHDVTTVDASTTVLGTHVAAPVLVAPTAMHRFFTDDGELATARAARDARTVFVVSMAATTSVEDVAAAVPDGLLWAQMYMLRDRGRTRALAERARASGYRAIVASVDGAAVGRGGAAASAGSLAAPEWMRYPNLASPDNADSSDIMALVSDFDPSITFDDLALFREWSGLPLVVKGVLRADDAARAVDAGAEAIAVSNHGGRIFDGLAATADVLPEVVDAVAGRARIIVDGSICRGTDIVKAVATGADLVGIGRMQCFALACGGRSGVLRLLELLEDEVQRCLGLLGAASFADLDRSYLHPAAAVNLPHVLSAFPLLKIDDYRY